MKEYIVYMVQCRNGSYYTGITNDIIRRISEHNAGIDPSCYTFTRRPVHLVYKGTFDDVRDAIAWEKKIKKWNREKKDALVRGEYEKLPKLSKRRMPFSSMSS